MLQGILSVSVLTSCAGIPNGPACVELGPTRGWCAMTLTEQEFYVDETTPYDGKNWEQLKATSIIIPATYFAQLKAELLKYCKKAKNCPTLTEFRTNAAEVIIRHNERRDQ